MRRVEVLTGLRGIAAYSVLLAHTIDYFFQGRFHPYVIGLGHFGMSLFFVLSGFVIQLNYGELFRKEPFALALRTFFVARFARLYPLYALMMAVSLIYFPSWDFVQHPLEGLSLVMLTQNWFNVSGVSGSIFGQSWSISTEWFFYVIFPLLAVPIATIRRPLRILVCSLGCSAGFFALASHFQAEIASVLAPIVQHGEPVNVPTWLWLVYFGPYLRALEFVAGAMACRVFLAPQDAAPGRTWKGTAIVAGSAAWCIMVMIVDYSDIGGIAGDFAQGMGFSLAIAPGMVALCLYEGWGSRMLSGLVLRFLGEISYSVYVYQFLVLWWVERLAVTPSRFSGPVGRGVITVIALTSVAALSYRLIELPARRSLRKFLMGSAGFSPSPRSAS